MPLDRDEWSRRTASIPVGSWVTGTVVAVHDFGVFVDIGVGINALLKVTRFAGPRVDGCIRIRLPSVGDKISARVLGVYDETKEIALTQVENVS
jgi:ribosomal protein S1